MTIALSGCGNEGNREMRVTSSTPQETKIEKEQESSILKLSKESTASSVETDMKSIVSETETTEELTEAELDAKNLTKDQVKEWVRAVVDVNIKPDSEMANYTLLFEVWGNGDGLTYVVVGPPEGLQIDNTLAIYRLNGEGKLQHSRGLGPSAEWKVVSEEFMDTSKVEVIKTEPKPKDVDTKSLTKEQAIDWVKNHWVENGMTMEELEENVGFKTDMVDGYLIISEYRQNYTGTLAGRTLSYIYRINDEGELEEGSIYNSDEWHVISREYFE